jgi:hypothetical protein
MGLEIIGLNPKSKTGNLLIWHLSAWCPLADHIIETCPSDITGKCRHWYSSDWDGLVESDALVIADILDEQVNSGAAEACEIASRKRDRKYYLHEGIIAEFAAFLRDSGGFIIG